VEDAEGLGDVGVVGFFDEGWRGEVGFDVVEYYVELVVRWVVSSGCATRRGDGRLEWR